MPIPEAEIDECTRAHRRLRHVATGFSNADISRPSALPGWTVGHVLTHLARNAEAMCRRIEAAARGELIEQYVGGAAGRANEIGAGAKRTAREIESDVIECSDRLDKLFRALPAQVWDRPVLTVAGDKHPASALPYRRWREVEVHLVDLGTGPAPQDWSQALVDRTLPQLVTGLSGRADQRDLMAWLLGRGPAPELDPWG